MREARLIADAIEEENLSAVVVAGCSSRTHGDLIGRAVERAGLNRNRAVLVNLKEHCARVHAGRRARAVTTISALR